MVNGTAREQIRRPGRVLPTAAAVRGAGRAQIVQREEQRREQAEAQRKAEVQKKEEAVRVGKLTDIKKILDKLQKIDKGKPFALFGETDAFIKLINKVKGEGVGKTREQRRTDVLTKIFPKINPSAIKV